MTAVPGRLLCLGCGYVAEALARHLLARGWSVSGTTRDPDRACELQKTGIEVPPLPAPGAEAGIPAGLLAEASHILVSAAPTETGDPFFPRVRDALTARPEKPRWLGYLSSTAVYGDRDGGWVTETARLRPGSPRARRRVQAETGWQRLGGETGVPVQVFRLSAIYGPGRDPFDRLRAGMTSYPEHPGRVVSRIHIDDITRALAATLPSPDPGAVFNLADDCPAPRGAFLAHASELLGIAQPRPVAADEVELSPMAREFLQESRRVSNQKLKRMLLPSLEHPTYREGLAAIFRARGLQDCNTLPHPAP